MILTILPHRGLTFFAHKESPVKLPLSIRELTGTVQDADGVPLFTTFRDCDSRAIAAAVNAHDALREACQDAAACLEVTGDAIVADPNHDIGLAAQIDLSRHRLRTALELCPKDEP